MLRSEDVPLRVEGRPRLSHNARILFLVKTTPLLASFGYLALAARTLRPDQLGVLALGAAILPITRALSQLGLDPLLQRQIAKAPCSAHRLLAGAARFLHRWTLPVLTFVSLCAILIAKETWDSLLPVWLIQSSLLFRSHIFLASSLTLGLENPRPLLLLENSVSIVRLLIGTMAAVVAPNVVAFALAYPVAEFAGYALARRAIPLPAAAEPHSLTRHPEFASTSLYNVFSTALVNADALLLNRLSSSMAVATYRIADRVSKLFEFSGYSIAMAAMPAAARSRESDARDPLAFARRSCVTQSLVLLILAALIALFGAHLLAAVFGAVYAGGAHVVALLLLSYVPVTWAQPATYLAIARGKTKWIAFAYGLGLGLAVIANLYAARFGPIGCALIAVASRTVVCLLVLIPMFRRLA